MVSLNPKYNIEVEILMSLADNILDTNPELYSILTTISVSILANDEKKLLEHCNSYLLNKMENHSMMLNLNDIFSEYGNNAKKDSSNRIGGFDESE